MGKLRKKHNWKGRQQSDPQKPADEVKTDVVLELKGEKHRFIIVSLMSLRLNFFLELDC